MERGQSSERSTVCSLRGTGETASLILCPVLGPRVKEGDGDIGGGSVKHCCDGLSGH